MKQIVCIYNIPSSGYLNKHINVLVSTNDDNNILDFIKQNLSSIIDGIKLVKSYNYKILDILVYELSFSYKTIVVDENSTKTLLYLIDQYGDLI
jgi:hypothetical protein